METFYEEENPNNIEIRLMKVSKNVVCAVQDCMDLKRGQFEDQKAANWMLVKCGRCNGTIKLRTRSL